MPGKVLHVCISARKGVPKREVAEALLCRRHGMIGDAHAGDWHRQLSLLAVGDIQTMEAKGMTLRPGAFGENLVVDGIDIRRLGIGSRLEVGNAEIEITQIGKECHSRCAIYDRVGDCIMPRCGLFAIVTREGTVRRGSRAEVVSVVPRHRPVEPQTRVSESAPPAVSESIDSNPTSITR